MARKIRLQDVSFSIACAPDASAPGGAASEARLAALGAVRTLALASEKTALPADLRALLSGEQRELGLLPPDAAAAIRLLADAPAVQALLLASHAPSDEESDEEESDEEESDEEESDEDGERASDSAFDSSDDGGGPDRSVARAMVMLRNWVALGAIVSGISAVVSMAALSRALSD